MNLSFRRLFLFVSAVALVAIPLMAPASASAMLVGAESNGELVNSDRTPALQAIALTKMQKQGVQVVRVNWGWNEVASPTCATQTLAQLEDPNNSCYSWTLLDSLVSQANARGIQVLISITRVPVWANGNANPLYMGATTAEFQKVMANYAAFHKAVATRYTAGSPLGTIKYWTIHNEPNSPNLWFPAPNAQRYAALFAAASKAVHAGNPSAVVAAGPTNPTGNRGIRPVRFIKDFQRWIPKYLPGAELRANLNAWAHNPYPGFNSQPNIPSALTPAESIGMGNINRLYSTLDASPTTRGLKVFATEFGWETSGNQRTTQARQAQFLAEAFNWLDSKNRVLIGINYGLTDPVAPLDFQSGTFNFNGTPKPAFKMFQRMISVPQAGLTNRVNRNATVAVWGRSNINPGTGVLAFKRPGDTVFRIVPGQRRKADGSITATVRISTRGTWQFAVYDQGNVAIGVAAGYGPTRVFSAR